MSDYTGSRHPTWFAGMVFCAIALTSLVTMIGNENVGATSMNQWAVSGVSITLSLSAISVFGNFLLREKFGGTSMEGGMALLVFAFWAAVLPTIMKPGNYANDADGGIFDANLYFFSWGAFIASLMVMMSFLAETRGIGVGDNDWFNAGSWAGLCMASFVVMVSSIRLWDNGTGCDLHTESYCNRLKFAMSIGVISAVLSAAWVFLGAMISVLLDTLMSVTMFVLWVFGVGFITFGGVDGPGTRIGNLYFFTWGSFVMTVFLAANGIHRMMGRGGEAEDAASENKDEKAVEGEGDKKEDAEEGA